MVDLTSGGAMKDFNLLHTKMLSLANNYKKAEIDFIEGLIDADKKKLCYKMRYSSLFQYVVQGLGLSEDKASTLIGLARKSIEVPQLGVEIKKGTISVYKAKRILSVINNSNKDKWLELAKTQSKAKLEKAVAAENPKSLLYDKFQYVNPADEVKEKITLKSTDNIKEPVRVSLQAGVSEKLVLKIRRVQDILSSKLKKAVSLEEALEAMAEGYLNQNDPIRKAKRQKIRGKLQVIKKQSKKLPCPGTVKPKRKPLTASVKHQVWLRDQGRCTDVDGKGRRCHQRRFLEAHHITPVVLGGGDEVENLTLLCSGHHKAHHVNN